MDNRSTMQKRNIKLFCSIIFLILFSSSVFSYPLSGYQPNLSEEEALEMALQDPNVIRALEGFELIETWVNFFENIFFQGQSMF